MARHRSLNQQRRRRILVAVIGTALAAAFTVAGPSTAIAEPGPDGPGGHHHHDDGDRNRHERDRRPAPVPAAPAPAAPAPVAPAPAAPAPAAPAPEPVVSQPQPALILPERTKQADPEEPAVPVAAIGTGVAVASVGGFAWLLAAGSRRRGES
jgi:hypothetical protein